LMFIFFFHILLLNFAQINSQQFSFVEIKIKIVGFPFSYSIDTQKK
jgi:hypothetical protein